MKIRVYAYLLSLLSLSIIGCSSDTVGSGDVNPAVVHQDYSLNYTEGSNISRFSAQFRVGGSSGTTVELEPPAKIYANGKSLLKTSFFGTGYALEQSGPYAAGNFEYVDDNGLRYHNSVPLKPVSITHNPTPIMLGANYYVVINTYPLEPGDSLQATIEQDFVANGVHKFVFITGSYEAVYSRFVFSSYDLNRLQNGLVKLTITRSHRTALAQAAPRAGGEISSHYSMRPITLTVYGQTFAPIPLLSL